MSTENTLYKQTKRYLMPNDLNSSDLAKLEKFKALNSREQIDFGKIYLGNLEVTAIYLGSSAIWQSVSSCFSGDGWADNLPWTNSDPWNN